MDNSKQWFLLLLAAVWLFFALALTAYVYSVTQDMRSLGLATLTAPPIAMLRLLYRYHFPPSAADYELQKLKLQFKHGRSHYRKRVRS